PAELLAAGPQKPRQRRQPDDPRKLIENIAATVALLQFLIESLSGELRAARAANDVLREQLGAAQAEAAELRGKSAANEAALEREAGDPRDLPQQAELRRRQ